MVTTVAPVVDPVAVEVNARIRAQAARFEVAPRTVLSFMCECGCMTGLAMSVSAYDGVSGAVFAPGHRLGGPSVIARLAVGVRRRKPAAR